MRTALEIAVMIALTACAILTYTHMQKVEGAQIAQCAVHHCYELANTTFYFK